MKKISVMIMVLVVALASCKKTPEVNLKYVDVERDLVTVGTTTANIQCDYEYIATLKKAYLYYGEGQDEANMTSAEMRVVQNTLYVELIGLRESTTYNYFYEFHNGFNSMRTVAKTFKTEGSGATITLPTVITAEVTEITINSAKGGGEVTNDGGAEVTERGICWSTNANPTLNNNHIAAGTGIGAFTAVMSGLQANTTYHVRAYAINEKGTAYGLDREFVTSSGGGSGEYEYVDLCLPSGTLWATCNLGANSPEEYGDYFAWGETETKNVYNWNTYKWCISGNCEQLNKYCTISDYGYNGFTDNLTILDVLDDAAAANWSDGWTMPTDAQWQELFDHTTHIWTTQGGVPGRLFTANNGASLFLPAAGNRWEGSFLNDTIIAAYWSNSLCLVNPITAYYTYIDSDECRLSADPRFGGHSVRAVRKVDSPIPPSSVPEGAINGLFTINENGDQVYFSQGNLQYQASTNTWRFAEHQWDYVGADWLGVVYGNVFENGVQCDNNLISPTYDGWIDLYCYGTSGYNHGAVCYQPWSISEDNSDYYAYGNSTYNLNDQTGQADWGYNAISNGGNTENIWRTLTIDEWDFVLFTRTTTTGFRYAKANVCGINGVILFPDNWDGSLYSVNNSNIDDVDFSGNIINNSDWVSIFETHGAVFMPVTGTRLVHSSTSFREGMYWSATYRHSDAINILYFSPTFFGTNIDNGHRHDAKSVRLAQDATPQNKAR